MRRIAAITLLLIWIAAESWAQQAASAPQATPSPQAKPAKIMSGVMKRFPPENVAAAGQKKSLAGKHLKKNTVLQAQAAAPAPVPVDPVPPPPVEPPEPPLPQTLANSPPVKPTVTLQNGLLTIDAPNSTLGDVLSAVHKVTGAAIEGATLGERVAVKLGPGNPDKVLAALLHGTSYDYVILGSSNQAEGITRILLSSANGSAQPGQQPQGQPMPNAPQGDGQPQPDEQPADDTSVAQPDPQPDPEPEQQQPEAAQPEPEQPPQQPPQQQQPPKSVDQLFKELQQMQGQQPQPQPQQ